LNGLHLVHDDRLVRLASGDDSAGRHNAAIAIAVTIAICNEASVTFVSLNLTLID
jgi:hypothetical protein